MMLRIWFRVWVRAEDRPTRSPPGLDVSVPGLGLAPGVAGLCRPGRRDCVLRIRLAAPAATLTVRPIDLHDHHSFALQMAGEPAL
jgi:hypothetical protein